MLCPVCSGRDIQDVLRRARLPAMQNYVHRTRESAVNAQYGELTLAVCGTCGFAWNRTFEPERLLYDEGYDNAVPSAVMQAYYAEIAKYLRDRYALDGGLVVDVGCGDGGFLRMLCDAVPGLRGIGVDPALEADSSEQDGRIVLIKDVFTTDVIREQPSLIVSRHVLEHIPQPVEFFRMIREALAAFEPCPCFFEFPDLEWILSNEAFWDFGYEHCNYFTAASATEALGFAGYGSVTARAEFGSQYLWVEAITSGDEAEHLPSASSGGGLSERGRAYGESEAARIERVRDRLRVLKGDGRAVAVWGMATKGVLFSLLVDSRAELVDYCVDVNPNKSGCYVPLTGHLISPPQVLERHGEERDLTVIVMNENYLDEIRRTCRELRVDATFVDANTDSV
jgi:SAM-dependent methyltransferase